MLMLRDQVGFHRFSFEFMLIYFWYRQVEGMLLLSKLSTILNLKSEETRMNHVYLQQKKPVKFVLVMEHGNKWKLKHLFFVWFHFEWICEEERTYSLFIYSFLTVSFFSYLRYYFHDFLMPFFLNMRYSGTRIKPESHPFFRRVEPLLNRHLEKANRENGFIYHQAYHF